MITKKRRCCVSIFHSLSSILLPFLLLMSCLACVSPQQKAKDALQKRGIMFDRDTLLHNVRRNNMEAVELLIQAGIPAETGLLAAARRGNCEMVKFLVDKGAAANLWKAAESLAATLAEGKTECIQIMREAGADLNARNELRETIAIKAVENNDVPLLNVLCRNGADLELKSGFGETALIVAAKKGHVEALQMLLQNGAKVNAADRDGWSPLMFAASFGNAEITRILLASGANANHTSNLNWTALQQAAKNGHNEIVQMLIARGANINFSSKTAPTPLLLAIRCRQYSVIQHLLAAGADPFKPVEGITAADLMRSLNDPQMLQLISKAHHSSIH